MKKLSVIAILLVAATTFFSSCNKSCGGWYGDRNLRFQETPTQQQVQKEANSTECLEPK